jgi:hypothetical protein
MSGVEVAAKVAGDNKWNQLTVDRSFLEKARWSRSLSQRLRASEVERNSLMSILR